MLTFVSGHPGPVAIWCAEVTHALFSSRAATDLFFPGTPQHLTLDLIRSRSSLAVAHISHPGNRMVAALCEAGPPFILIADDPRHTLMVFLEKWNINLPDALRAIASGAAAARQLARSKSAILLHAQAIERDPSALVREVAAQYGVDPVGIALPPHPDFALSRDWTQGWAALPQDQQQLAQGALGAFCGTDAPQTMEWGAPLFKTGPLLEDRLMAPVDITGRARILFQGPFINLPPGTWDISLTLSFCAAAAQLEYLLEAETDRIIFSTVIRPTDEGGHVVAMRCLIDDTMDQPFFLRLSTMRAAFDGQVALESVSLAFAALQDSLL